MPLLPTSAMTEDVEEGDDSNDGEDFGMQGKFSERESKGIGLCGYVCEQGGEGLLEIRCQVVV
jgi:hypothetical protein